MLMKIVIGLFVVFAGLHGHPLDSNIEPPSMESIYEENKDLNLQHIDEVIQEDDIPDIPEVQRALIKKSKNMRWPNGAVSYVINNVFSSRQKEIIRSAVRQIEAVTCIKFKEYSVGRTQGHYINVINGGGCYSYVGKVNFHGRQDLSLRIPGCVHKGVAIHEFIHALGVYHEQARPDRDDYIYLYKENMVNNAWNQFAKRNDVDSLNVAYDGRSIMHYSNRAFSRNGKNTIVWKKNPNKRLGGSVMTASDIKQLNLLYECNNPPVKPTTTTTTTTTTTPMPTTTTTPMTTKMTTKQPKGCSQKDPICEELTDDPKYYCQEDFVKRLCPILCDTCDGEKTSTMALTTTTMEPTTTTMKPITTTTMEPTTTMKPITTEKPVTGTCKDVSTHCNRPVCTWKIYQRRCRKACGLCNSPLPYDCRGTVDMKSDCVSRAKKGECRRSSYYMKRNCKQSCCLRKR